MGAFRKRNDLTAPVVDRGAVLTTTVSKTVEVRGKDGFVSQHIELKEVPVEEHAKSLGLPDSDHYQLRDMLAAGIMPKEVSVSGMLDSSDPTDLRNVGAVDSLLSQLPENEPAVSAAAVSEPEPTNSPSE